MEIKWTDDVSAVIRPTSLNDDLSTRPIHRCFHRGHFNLPCPGSETIVRLFSHFQAQTLHLTHAILTGTITTVKVGELDVPRFPEPKATAALLTPKELDNLEISLDEVISHVEVVFGDAKEIDAGAMTEEQPGRKLPTLPGLGCKITVGRNVINDLEQAFAGNNVMAQQYHMFELARTLYHEFGHVLDGAARTEQSFKNGAFLGHGHTEEIGLEMEKRLFGGIIASWQSRLRPVVGGYERSGCQTLGPNGRQIDVMIVAYEWPIPHVIERYSNLPDKTFSLQGPSPPAIWREWKVPFSYITRMFQDDFWCNSRAISADGKALHPPKNAGFLKESWYGMEVDLGPGDPRAREFVPCGYQLLGNGMIVKKWSS